LKPVFALEISPLGERRHTGIANVTKALASEMLSDESIEARFFFQRAETPRETVESILKLDGGEILWWLAGRLDARPKFRPGPGRTPVGLFPATKRHRRLFPFEVLIVHDLTAITAPHLHTPEAARFWQERALVDMLSSDLIVAVSQSTRIDIETYFPQARQIPCIVAPLAAAQTIANGVRRSAEDFVLVLGTLEPRKNVDLVLEVLSENPDLFDAAKFAFVGRSGWGETIATLVGKYGLTDRVASGDIIFTGFVSDPARNALLANARLVVYPSRYEGFGLPVLESLACGAPVLTSFSSSLPEVGGEVAEYCDFDSKDSLVAKLKSMLARPDHDSAQRTAWAGQFTWANTYRRIRDAALDHALAN
jgi:glycosyltransferase involved in cell wall biosynthesis